jgi:hypothetical protein
MNIPVITIIDGMQVNNPQAHVAVQFSPEGSRKGENMLYAKTCTLICLVLVGTISVLSQTTARHPADRSLIKDFENRAKAYITLRDRIKKSTPVVKKDATPAEIEAYKDTLQKAILAARANAHQGDIFTPAAVSFVKLRIKNGLPGFEKSEIRTTVLESDTKGVPIKVNAIYPESKELVQMSPTLLLSLPQLPKDLRYRFIGRSLAIMDRDSSLIIDYMPNALP